MARLSEKQRLIATIIAVTLVVLGGGAGIYLLYDKWQALEAEVGELQKTHDDIKQKERQNAEWEAKHKKKEYVDEQRMLDRQLPNKSPTGDTDMWLDLNRMRRAYPSLVLRKVEGVVERPGVIVAYSPPPGVRKSIYKVFLRGKFFDIMEYLSQIENGDRVIRLEALILNKLSTTAMGADIYREDVFVEAAVGLLGFEYEGGAPSGGTGAGGGTPSR